MALRTKLLPLMVLTAALVVPAVPGGASSGSSTAVPRLSMHVDRDLGAQFGGRVDVTVRFRVVNTSVETVQPIARIQLESQIGGGTRSAPIPLGPLDPGDHVDVVRTVGSLLPFGSAHAVVTVRTDGGVTTARASTAVIPWLLLLVIVVVVLLAFAVRRARRHARTASGAAGRARLA